MDSLLFELLRIAIGKQDRISRCLTVAEWKSLFNEMKRQSVIGVCVYAISRLPEEQLPPRPMLKAWKQHASIIYTLNVMMDSYTAKIWETLTRDGLDCAILKGQGLAPAYGALAPYRQPGDIDVWVNGGFDRLNKYVQATHPTKVVDYHHLHYDIFKEQGVEVELHHRAVLMRNPFDNMRLQRWCDGFSRPTFQHLKDKGFAIPSTAFNRVFLMVHAYKHFIYDGIGIRQMMDCYLTYRTTQPGRDELKTFESLHLIPFLRAMMWVFAYVFEGVRGEYIARAHFPWMVCEPDEKEGRFLLQEMMLSGTFAQHDTRYGFGRFAKLRYQIRHGLHLLIHYPSEILWIPLWLVWHQGWKVCHRNCSSQTLGQNSQSLRVPKDNQSYDGH